MVPAHTNILPTWKNFLPGISSITLFQRRFTEKVILVIFYFFFFFLQIKLFLTNSSFLRAAKCQRQSYGWCQLRVEAHAPFPHSSCGSLAVQTLSAARVPVTAELLMNIDHVQPDLDLNQVDGKSFLKAHCEVFVLLWCRVFRMNLKKKSSRLWKVLAGWGRICTFSVVISFIYNLKEFFSTVCIYIYFYRENY